MAATHTIIIQIAAQDAADTNGINAMVAGLREQWLRAFDHLRNRLEHTVELPFGRLVAMPEEGDDELDRARALLGGLDAQLISRTDAEGLLLRVLAGHARATIALCEAVDQPPEERIVVREPYDGTESLGQLVRRMEGDGPEESR